MADFLTPAEVLQRANLGVTTAQITAAQAQLQAAYGTDLNNLAIFTGSDITILKQIIVEQLVYLDINKEIIASTGATNILAPKAAELVGTLSVKALRNLEKFGISVDTHHSVAWNDRVIYSLTNPTTPRK